MDFIHPELIETLKTHQEKLSENLTAALSTDPELPIKVEVGEIGAVKTADLYNELGVPILSIQFGFADIPEHPHVFLLQDEVALAIASHMKAEKVDAVDENLVSEIRITLEGVVQAVCMTAGKIRNEPVVATNLAIRHQVFSFPPNLQRHDELICVRIALIGEEPIGVVTWLMDPETAAAILTNAEDQENETSPFLQIEGGGALRGSDETSGIELLMDIPLEISVELGRVKMLVKDVVELGTGSIVEIDKSAGEPVDVMVNGRVVAKGEVVVIEDNFGVRITEILTPQERLARLGEVA